MVLVGCTGSNISRIGIGVLEVYWADFEDEGMEVGDG